MFHVSQSVAIDPYVVNIAIMSVLSGIGAPQADTNEPNAITRLGLTMIDTLISTLGELYGSLDAALASSAALLLTDLVEQVCMCIRVYSCGCMFKRSYLCTMFVVSSSHATCTVQLSHACYRKNWRLKYGACEGLRHLVCVLPRSWTMHHYDRLAKACMFTLRDHPIGAYDSVCGIKKLSFYTVALQYVIFLSDLVLRACSQSLRWSSLHQRVLHWQQLQHA